MDLEITPLTIEQQNQPQENKSTTEGKCIICGKETKISGGTIRKTCSDLCFKKLCSKLATRVIVDPCSKETLWQLYFVEGLSMMEICDKFSVSLHNLYKIFVKYDIQPKTRAEITIERNNKRHSSKSKPITVNGKIDIVLLKQRLGLSVECEESVLVSIIEQCYHEGGFRGLKKKLGICDDTIHIVLNYFGIKLRPSSVIGQERAIEKANKLAEEYASVLRTYLTGNTSIQKLCKQLGVRQGIVYKSFEILGIKPRSRSEASRYNMLSKGSQYPRWLGMRGMEASMIRPTKPELIIGDFLVKCGFEYIGAGGKGNWVGGYNPDFINRAQHKIVEFFGCWWHGCPICFDHNQYPKFIDKNNKDLVRVDNYKKEGYDTLIIWEHDFVKGDCWQEMIKKFNEDNNDKY
ncbi:MAG: hypothetical protein WC460_06715 [Patescibacteria group bacterium]